MDAGVYRHREHPELLYLLNGLARDHDSGEEVVVYTALFTRESWHNWPRMTVRPTADFHAAFEWVGDRQP